MQGNFRLRAGSTHIGPLGLATDAGSRQTVATGAAEIFLIFLPKHPCLLPAGHRPVAWSFG